MLRVCLTQVVLLLFFLVSICVRVVSAVSLSISNDDGGHYQACKQKFDILKGRYASSSTSSWSRYDSLPFAI